LDYLELKSQKLNQYFKHYFKFLCSFFIKIKIKYCHFFGIFKVDWQIDKYLILQFDHILARHSIGIDRGGNGMSVEHELLHLDKFRENHFSWRLKAYDFGGYTTIGDDNMLKPIKKKTKEYMTSLINELFYTKKLQFPSEDAEIENQFCSQTYIHSDRGIIYSKGNDHIIDATRCAVLKRSQENNPFEETIIISPGLMPVPFKLNY
jgi:hypothetical protein